jgi:hypothetical protein
LMTWTLPSMRLEMCRSQELSTKPLNLFIFQYF